MLTKRQDGLYTDKLGFIAAIMLKWNTKIDNIDHYVFIANAFDPIPYTITSNEIDNSVLVSLDMFNILVAKGVARAVNDEEASAANQNAVLEETNEILAQNEVETKLQLKLEAEKPASTINPSQAAKPVSTVTPIPPTTEQAAFIAAAKVAEAIMKKGK